MIASLISYHASLVLKPNHKFKLCGIQSKSKTQKLTINNGKISRPCQTRFYKILGKWIHTSKTLIAGKQGSKIHQTNDQSKPSCPSRKQNRTPQNAQWNLGNVEDKCIGLGMKSTVSPNKPSWETHEEGREECGKVYEPERREPKGLG